MRHAYHRVVLVNQDKKSGVCSVCGPSEIRMRKAPDYKSGVRWVCKNTDKRWGRENNGRPRMGWRHGECEICKNISRLVYDHNHADGSFRGWICRHCNCGLGFFRDNVDNLITAARYLETS